MENEDSYSVDNTNVENAVKAKLLKELGNEEFQVKNYEKSIDYYSRAIDLKSISSKDRSILYSNRCIAFIKLNKLENAIKDAKQVLKLRPQWWKGYYRMAQYYYAKQDSEYLIECERFLVKSESCERNENITQLLNEVRYKVTLKDYDYEFRYESKAFDNLIKFMEKTTVHKGSISSSKDPVLINRKYCKEGHKYCLGTDGYPVDYEKAMKFYSMAADRGSAEAYLSLALMVCERNDVKKDFGLAFKYLLKAAEQPFYNNIGKNKAQEWKNFGVAEAEHMLALWYENGIYVKQNIKEAVNWYEKSVDHEDVNSANNLAIIYLKGNDFIEKDIEKAEQLFKYAAIGQHPSAMGNLALFYLVNRNPKMAIKWCEWSRENGSIEPQLNYIELQAKFELLMTPSNISEFHCIEDNKKYLTNPHRKQVIREHRQNIKDCFEFDDFQYYATRTSIPSKIQKSVKSLRGLKSICLNDMNPTLDKVYNGYLINVKSIDIVSSAGLSLELVIEDDNKDVERCFIYNSRLINDMNLANQLYGIGCQFSVINPYYSISVDLKPGIRIDDINSIVIRDYMENVCRYCCEANATKYCSFCKKSMYCTKECQVNDWNQNSHKLICTKL